MKSDQSSENGEVSISAVSTASMNFKVKSLDIASEFEVVQPAILSCSHSKPGANFRSTWKQNDKERLEFRELTRDQNRLSVSMHKVKQQTRKKQQN